MMIRASLWEKPADCSDRYTSWRTAAFSMLGVIGSLGPSSSSAIRSLKVLAVEVGAVVPELIRSSRLRDLALHILSRTVDRTSRNVTRTAIRGRCTRVYGRDRGS